MATGHRLTQCGVVAACLIGLVANFPAPASDTTYHHPVEDTNCPFFNTSRNVSSLCPTVFTNVTIGGVTFKNGSCEHNRINGQHCKPNLFVVEIVSTSPMPELVKLGLFCEPVVTNKPRPNGSLQN
ncbi:uncharacterized protein [Procambarus clarkii]|uniref:uncharacterized protein n=1 Tax=Procambarus clarkii TaxID=6728 RepID=UPI0037449021